MARPHDSEFPDPQPAPRKDPLLADASALNSDEGRGWRQAPRIAREADLADSEEVHLLDYVRILYKRRWTAATAFVVVVAGVAVSTLTATPVYESRARLLIEAEKANVVTFKEVIDQDQTTDIYYQTQYKLLEGRALAARTIERLDLWDHPLFSASRAARRIGALDRIWIAIRGVLPLPASTPKPASAQAQSHTVGETRRQSQAIDAFLARLAVSPVKGSRLVDLQFRAPDAALAADMANTHARGYIEQVSEFKLLASKEASGWLGEQLAEQRKKVETSEVAFQRYREQNDGVSMEDKQNIVVQRLADISAAVTRAKTERIEKESRYRQIVAIERNPTALDTFPAILSNAFIQQLKTQLADQQRQQALLSDQLGERHPDMIRITTAIQSAEAKLQVEIAKVVEGVRNDYLAAQTQELSLANALESQKHEALAMNRKGIEGNVLKRDTESNRQLYDSLLQRTKETGVSGELKTSNIRLVDLAEVPRVPVSPNKTQNILLGFVGGILLAGLLVVFFEHLDDRIKTPDEIATHLRLSTLGLVPRVAPKLLGQHPLISNGVPPNFAEAYRAIRTSVLFSPTDVGVKTVVVTSTGPGEGKTTTASNLAVGIAQTGERVLLIDTDMRRPQVHHMFDMEQEPGLSNLLVGNARSRQAIRASGIEGLWVLPAGHLPPNPAEILASERFKHFLTALGEHFQWVVLDSPPVLAVDDASIVAHLAHGIVFVIGAEMTSRRAAETAIARLERVNGRFIGAVLNHVQLDRHRFYYSRYYRREYGDYYARAGTGMSRPSPAFATTSSDALEPHELVTVSANHLQGG